MTKDLQKSRVPRRLRALHENVRAALRKLRGGELSRGKLAGSVALGLFVGCTPLYGLQTVVTAGLAVLFRLDIAISYVCSNVSLPPLIPVLLFAEAQIGSMLVHGRWLDIAVHELRPEKAGSLGLSIIVGSLLVSSVVALVGAALTYSFSRRSDAK